MSFVYIILEELNDYLTDYLKSVAIATRVAQLEGNDFKEYIETTTNKDESKSTKKVPMVIDHEAQMKQFLQG